MIFKHFFRFIHILHIIAKYRIFNLKQLMIPIFYKIIIFIFNIIFAPFSFFQGYKKSYAQCLRLALTELGPIFIKLGQTLSIRPDLVGIEIAAELRNLQDKLSAFNFEHVEIQLKKQLSLELTDFLEFAKQPVAAASIAQVHKAKLKTGENVAVKILRPGIKHKYQQDIELLKFLAKIANYFLPKYSRIKPLKIVKVFEQAMHCELDLRMEAAACSELRDNLITNENIIIPKIYWQYTAEQIFTSSWVEGISIYNIKELKQHNLNLNKIAANIAVTFFDQAFKSGFFHADLHPGNIMVDKKGRIILVDFGIMGRLKERDRLAIAEIINSFIYKDYFRVADIHIEVGYIPHDADRDLFAQTCRAIGEPIIGQPVDKISIGKLLGQLFKVSEEFKMPVQQQLIQLQKTMIVVEGIGKKLNPQLNLWALAEPWIKDWAVKNITYDAKIIKAVKKLTKKIILDIENYADSDLEH